MKVAPGQIWEDLDKRRQGRLFKVATIMNNVAHVTPVEGGCKCTQIRIDRFKPKYYKLITEKSKETKTQSSLKDLVVSVLNGWSLQDWEFLNQTSAKVEIGACKFYLRQVSKDDFEVKCYLNKSLILAGIFDQSELSSVNDVLDTLSADLQDLYDATGVLHELARA